MCNKCCTMKVKEYCVIWLTHSTQTHYLLTTNNPNKRNENKKKKFKFIINIKCIVSCLCMRSCVIIPKKSVTNLLTFKPHTNTKKKKRKDEKSVKHVSHIIRIAFRTKIQTEQYTNGRFGQAFARVKHSIHA